MSYAKYAACGGLVLAVTVINLSIFLQGRNRSYEELSTGGSAYNYDTDDHENNTSVNFKNIRTLEDLMATTSTHSPSLDFMTEQAVLQKQRRKQMHDTCTEYHRGGTLSDLLKAGHLGNLIVDEKYKLIYCAVPKIASTSWKRVLLVLRGVMNDTYDLTQPEVNNKVAPVKLKHLQFYEQSDMKRMLRDYTKFLVVRDPFSRVLSAFRNKLDPATDFPRAEKWQTGLGMKIQNKYKPKNAKTRSTYKMLMTKRGRVKYDLDFGDFVKYLVGIDRANNVRSDVYWSEINTMCSPCVIDYDVISKMETVDTDAEYILRRIHADSVVNFPTSIGSSPTNSSKESTKRSYFERLPKKDLEELYSRYQLDCELFGYEKPDVLKGTSD